MAYQDWLLMMDEREKFHQGGGKRLNDDGCLALVLVILGYLNSWDYFEKDEYGEINFKYQYRCGAETSPNPKRVPGSFNPIRAYGKLRRLY